MLLFRLAFSKVVEFMLLVQPPGSSEQRYRQTFS
jgi:hypothetical protein